MDDEEIWRPSRLHPGVFVSSHGRIRGVRGRIQKPQLTDRGYLRAKVGPRDRRVHRVVADAFHGPIPPGMSVNHIDGNKLNNRADNLEIVTHVENMRHAGRMGLMRSKQRGLHNIHAMGEKNPSAKLSREAVLEIRRRFDAGESRYVLAATFGVAASSIFNIGARRVWKWL